MVIGRKRTDESETAIATAGRLAPAAMVPNSTIWPGAAQMSTVERTPAPIG